jgi:hypothetical protein
MLRCSLDGRFLENTTIRALPTQPGYRSQEQHIILEIDRSRGFDKPLCLDFGDCHFRIGEGVHLEVVEAEIFHCPHKPGDVTHHLLPPL